MSEIEELETQQPVDIQNMVQDAIDGEFVQANNTFADIMTVKLNDLLDQESVRLSDQIFNGVEDDVDPNEEEQLELDIEAEYESESEDEDDEEDEEDDEI